MKKIRIYSILILSLSVRFVLANEFTVVAPQITLTGHIAGTEAELKTLQDTINLNIEDAFQDIHDDANEKIEKYLNLNNLARGFANSGIYALEVATLQGQQNYDVFALTGGFCFGLQTPNGHLQESMKTAMNFAEEPNILFGVTPLFGINLGLHLGLLDLFPTKLYASVKFGTFNDKFDVKEYKPDMEGVPPLTLNTLMFGFSLNYGILPRYRLFHGLLVWNGLSVGSGFSYFRNVTNIDFKIDKIEQDIPVASQDFPDPPNPDKTVDLTGHLVFDPTTEARFNVKLFSFPLEISTSVKILQVLNLNFGCGLNINFGSSSVLLNSSSEIVLNVESSDEAVVTVASENGQMTLNGNVTSKPQIADFKVMTGLGINLGPIKIDVPFIYYPVSGFSLGLVVGIIW